MLGIRTCALVRSPLLLVGPFLLCFSSTVSALADCDDFTPFGQPVHRSLAGDVGVSAAPEWTVICHAGQVVAFNSAHNVSDWVAFRLRREDLLAGDIERKDAFRGDPEVPEGHRVVKADYTGTGYDRGHLASAAAMKWSPEAMRESFFMSNMAPQVGTGFNRHIWKSLERRMRQWACERGVLYVVTGPLYEEQPVKQLVYDKDGDGVDDNGVLVDVPSHFFKLAFDSARIEAIAFLWPVRQGVARSGSGRRVRAAWDGTGWHRHGVRARRSSYCRRAGPWPCLPSTENASTWPRMRLASEAPR